MREKRNVSNDCAPNRPEKRGFSTLSSVLLYTFTFVMVSCPFCVEFEWPSKANLFYVFIMNNKVLLCCRCRSLSQSFLTPSLSLSLPPSVSRYVSLCFLAPSLFLSVCTSICLFLSVFFYVCLSVCLSLPPHPQISYPRLLRNRKQSARQLAHLVFRVRF